VCWYIADQLPLHTSFKSRQVAERASTRCHALWLQTSPPYWDGLRCCHVSNGSGPRLPVEVGSDAATCPATPDLASRLRWVPTLPRVLWLWTSPPSSGGLWRWHVSYGSGPRLPAEVSSDAAKCHITLDLASWARWAPTLLRVPRLSVGHVPQA
jgi:hypothetical protein